MRKKRSTGRTMYRWKDNEVNPHEIVFGNGK
jgi:hypothetical protein